MARLPYEREGRGGRGIGVLRRASGMRGILIVDDHALFAEGLAAALRTRWPEARVALAANADQGLECLAADDALELALIDAHLGAEDGYDALARFGGRFPQVARVMMSGVDDAGSAANRARERGASGFIPKSATLAQLLDALAAIAAGEVRFLAGSPLPAPAPGTTQRADFTVREFEVLTLLGDGMPNKTIANRLGISERTVKSHLTAIFERLSAANRTQAVLAAQRIGLLPERRPG